MMTAAQRPRQAVSEHRALLVPGAAKAHSACTLALMLVALALSCGPALALTPEEEQELAQRISAGARPQILRLNDTAIEDYKRPADAAAGEDKVHEFLVIRSPWDEPVKLAAYSFAMRTLQVGGGPGPNAIYMASSGAGKCCFTAHLIWIENRMHHQAIVLLDSDLKIEAHGGPPRLRFQDDSMAGWSGGTAAPPGLEVVLAYDPRVGEYRLDPEAMRKPPPSDATLADQAAQIRKTDEAIAADVLDHSLSAAMLDLIYGGNAPSARALLDAAWPEAKPGKEKFLADFTRQLWAGETWRRFELGRLLEAEEAFPRPTSVQ